MIAFIALFNIVDILLFMLGAAIFGWAAGCFYWEYKNPLIVPHDYDMPHSTRKRYEKTIE